MSHPLSEIQTERIAEIRARLKRAQTDGFVVPSDCVMDIAFLLSELDHCASSPAQEPSWCPHCAAKLDTLDRKCLPAEFEAQQRATERIGEIYNSGYEEGHRHALQAAQEEKLPESVNLRDWPKLEPPGGQPVDVSDIPWPIYTNLLACATARQMSLHFLCNIYRAGKQVWDVGDSPASAPTDIGKRIELSMRLGQILGPEYDGVGMEEIARELVSLKLQLKVVPASGSVPQEPLREALEDMVYQFGYDTVKDGQPAIFTGGLSALEGAFEALGWDEPYIIPDPVWCDAPVEPRCPRRTTCGTPTPDGYKRFCHEHFSFWQDAQQLKGESASRPPQEQRS